MPDRSLQNAFPLKRAIVASILPWKLCCAVRRLSIVFWVFAHNASITTWHFSLPVTCKSVSAVSLPEHLQLKQGMNRDSVQRWFSRPINLSWRVSRTKKRRLLSHRFNSHYPKRAVDYILTSISARRLASRPAAVSLSATGLASPAPIAVIPVTPLLSR